MSNTPRTIYLKDYEPPHYCIETVDLVIHLAEEETIVKAQLHIRANGHEGTRLPLVLQGCEMELLSVKLNGQLLSKSEYQQDDEQLILQPTGDFFELETSVRIHPEKNLALMGLYKAKGNFCTQCEAEGFRRITYYVDRPDNLAIFTTTLIADKTRYPILLSNGNPVDKGDLPEGQHFVKWHDPFKKAGHLFALVAGDLECLEDSFTTLSGRVIALQLFVEKGNLHKTEHAMMSLKQAMTWDEEKYGREYDLDIFMTVAISSFNMGAMENKGLNIFNDKYILATTETATDLDYENITRVVGHEYFHNWSGNRVGCRDWFQLSLKEGFTVFRDQSFTADMTSPAVKRIEDVKTLRAGQFVEDAGPLAHPVRPSSYMEINNFYTMTVYEKGAELIRMLHTMLGEETFRKATDYYFSLYDGQVTTTDNFVSCMEEASGLDLKQFRLWYDQAGTPELSITEEYDPEKQEYVLHIKQHTPETPGQSEKEPLLIPFKMALLNNQGEEMASDLIKITAIESRFVFPNIPSKPIPSFLRGFSAPVKLHYDYSDEQLKTLLVYGRDPFARWEAGQTFGLHQLLKFVKAIEAGEAIEIDPAYVASQKDLLYSAMDPALLAVLITLPSETHLADCVTPIDPLVIYAARKQCRIALAKALYTDFLALYKEYHEVSESAGGAENTAKRALKNVCLSYLMSMELPDAEILAEQQYQTASNMTDRFAALSLLSQVDIPTRGQVIDDFYHRFEEDPLVLDKWLSVQAMSPLPGTLEQIQNLTKHPAFDIKNPNKVRSLLGSFAKNNPLIFHALDNSGYRYLAEKVLEIDAFNPQVAARLVQPLTEWRRFKSTHADLMKGQLEYLLKKELSKDVFEIVSKALV